MCRNIQEKKLYKYLGSKEGLDIGENQSFELHW